ncbi:MAG TPA: hypothetical protein VGT99_13560 [Gammaproteobacteria bacterium]|nr:hypothetical protein [Gammaproteobacteria bacterium]
MTHDTETAPMLSSRYPVLTAILLGGLIAGTVDIGAASLIGMVSPLAVTRAIASGLIGKAVHGGGLPVSFLGLLLQWAMGMLIAAIYMLATAVMPGMRRRWIPTGIVAGVIIYFVMVYLVLPFSAAPFRQAFDLQVFIKDFALDGDFVKNMLAMMLFGLIVGFCARDVPGVNPARD